LEAQLASVQLAAVREVDRRDLGKTTGYTSTAAWLSDRYRVRPETAGRTVKLGRTLDTSLPATGAALREGRISADHAHVIAGAIAGLPSEAGPVVRGEAEQVLLQHAATFHPKDLARLGRTVLNTIDPDLADQVLAKELAKAEKKAARERELSLHDDPYGLGTWIRGRLDPITADMLRTALEPLSAPMPTTPDGPDTRSAAQRLGDGFAELIRRYLDAGASPSHAGEKPHLIVTIDLDRLRDGTGVATLLGSN